MVLQVLEKTLIKYDSIFKAYCDIKPLIENEKISIEYIQEDETETLFKRLMNEKLNFDDFMKFEELLDEAGSIAWTEEYNFLKDTTSMNEHFWVKNEP